MTFDLKDHHQSSEIRPADCPPSERKLKRHWIRFILFFPSPLHPSCATRPFVKIKRWIRKQEIPLYYTCTDIKRARKEKQAKVPKKEKNLSVLAKLCWLFSSFAVGFNNRLPDGRCTHLGWEFSFTRQMKCLYFSKIFFCRSSMQKKNNSTLRLCNMNN